MKTIKISDEAFDVLSTIKVLTSSGSFGQTILKMDEAIRNFLPQDALINRSIFIGIPHYDVVSLLKQYGRPSFDFNKENI